MDEHIKREIEGHIVRILRLIGDDPARAGLLGTPDRIARMYGEIFRGYHMAEHPKITTFPNGQDGLTYTDLIVDRGDFYSMCEHHMMPFFGHYVFGYVPSPEGKILGISKVGRIVDFHAARLQIQERLVTDILEDIDAALGGENPPLGLALYMEAEHLCKTMRGPKKKGTMSCASFAGPYFVDPDKRKEFLQLCK